MDRQKKLEEIFAQYELEDFRWSSGKDIRVAHWVRVKCMFGCDNYGKSSSCPPNTLPVEECRQFFNEYDRVVLFHFEKEREAGFDQNAWSREINSLMYKLEKDVFLMGFHKAFCLYIDDCNFCKECVSDRADCKNKAMCRPCTEAFAVDVYETAREFGYPINVLKEKTETMNRYAILLIE